MVENLQLSRLFTGMSWRQVKQVAMQVLKIWAFLCRYMHPSLLPNFGN